MFDAHTHCDRVSEDVLHRATAAGIQGMVVAGVGPQGWQAQAAMDVPWVWHTFGLHPWSVANLEDDALPDVLKQLADRLDSQAKAVGIGETGLDRGRRCPPESLARQERAFRAQLNMAQQRNLPVVLHIVRAHAMAIDILQEMGLPKRGGMVHSFSGSPSDAKRYAALGLHISFAGSVTHPNAHKARQAAIVVPEGQLLVETDAPDQTPHARRPGPNEPAFLIDVIAAVAQARGESPAHVAEITARNARHLFDLPSS